MPSPHTGEMGCGDSILTTSQSELGRSKPQLKPTIILQPRYGTVPQLRSGALEFIIGYRTSPSVATANRGEASELRLVDITSLKRDRKLIRQKVSGMRQSFSILNCTAITLPREAKEGSFSDQCSGASPQPTAPIPSSSFVCTVSNQKSATGWVSLSYLPYIQKDEKSHMPRMKTVKENELSRRRRPAISPHPMLSKTGP